MTKAEIILWAFATPFLASFMILLVQGWVMFWRMPGAQQWQSIVVAAEAIILGLATGLASVGVGLAGERYGHIYLGGIALSFWGLFAYAERFGYDRAFWTALAMLCLLTVSLVFHQEMQYR